MRSLFGYDWDREKITLASLAAGGAAHFEVADLRAPPSHSADTVLVFDVLQYLTVDEQQNLLGALVMSLRPGGRLLLRVPYRGRGWQTALSQILERLGKALDVNRSHTLVFRPSCHVKSDLEALELTVKIAKYGNSSLLDNRLWIAELNR